MAVPVANGDNHDIMQLHYALPTTSSINTSYLRKMSGDATRRNNDRSEYGNRPVQINPSLSLPEQEMPNTYQCRNANIKYPELVSDSARRQTFNTWPYEAVQSVDGLVQAGFWFRGNDDKVTCYSCGKTMYNWEQTDDPWYQHALWSPHCDHVVQSKGQPYITRILADHEMRNNTEVRENNAEGSGLPQVLIPAPGPLQSLVPSSNSGPTEATQAVTSSAMASLPIISQLSITPRLPHPLPHHPDFSDINARRATYRNWNYSAIQSEEGLAKAGFFYKGVGDQVTCFHCGYTLHNWDDTDCPWEEHKKWSPQCPLVLEYLEEGSPAEGVTVRPESPIDHIDTPNEGISQSNTGKEKRKQKKRKSKKILESPEVKPTESAEGGSLQHQSQINDLSELREENFTLKEHKLCKVCLTEDINVVFLPCGHLVCCMDCANRVSHCPICRKYIRGTVKTYWG